MRFVIAALMALAMGTPIGLSGELAGVDLAEQVTVDGETLVLNGMGLRKKLWIEVYVAGLYLGQKTTDAAAAVGSDDAKKIVMHFLTDRATKKKMDAAWFEGFERNSPDDYADLEDRVKEFVDLFGDLSKGDVIELNIVPGTGTVAFFNGSKQGVIEGDDFAAALLRVWLGDHPPSDDLRRGLLGQ